MQTQFEPRKLQNWLLALTAGGTLITAVVVAFFVATPFYQHDKRDHQRELQNRTTLLGLAVNEHLNIIRFTAAQISSRTHARQLLEQYRDAGLELAQLQAQTQPILEDAGARTPQILGITRLGADHRPLVTVGQTPDAMHWPIPEEGIHTTPRIGPPLQSEGQTVMLVGSPIYDGAGQRLGTDIVTFSAAPLLQLIKPTERLSGGETTYLGIPQQGAFLLVAADGSTSRVQPDQALHRMLSRAVAGESGVISPDTGAHEDAVIAFTPLDGESDWGLALRVTEQTLYMVLKEQALFLAAVVGGLILIAIMVIITLLRPLTSRMLIHTDELRQQIQKNTIELQHTNRALSAISTCSNALVHARDERELLQEICNIIVSVGGHRMAWIGYAQDDEAKSILPMAQAGFEEGYLVSVKITWAEDDPLGRGPGGSSIRNGTPCIVRDVLNDARFEPWREVAAERGFASVVGLPLTYEEKTFGTLLIYSAERDAFDAEEVRLLSELADDLAYGIMMLRTRDEHQWAEQELIDSEERWRSLTENSPDHILTLTPALRIEFANYAAPGQTVEGLIGTPILDYIDDPAKRREVEAKLKTTLTEGTPCSYETEYTTPAGDTLYYESRVAPRIVDGNIVGLTLSARDITQRKRDEAKIEHLAYHDELTDLPNRRLLMDRLQHALSVARRHKTMGALLFLDLDRFKNINDSLGHAVGDAILCEVARRLKQSVRAEDSVARLGGDEFMVLLPELKGDEQAASYEANIVAEKLQYSLSQPYLLDGHQHHTTPSIGVVIFPFAKETAEDVLKHADTAMYRAKSAGRDQIRFYRPSMQEAVDRRLALEKRLRDALREQAFQLYYQPLVDSQHRVVGSEALLRWPDQDDGWISPEEFIPIAEDTGIIQPLGEWVLDTALAQLKRWQVHEWAQAPGFMAINISARQFHQANFVDTITQTLGRHGLKPELIKLELTESLLIQDVVDTLNKMEALRQLGVHIAIDDFGTGYSSLAYLKRLPIDQIKIDKSFVQDLTHDSNDAAIVETIISVARHLSLGVVAEGVESTAIVEALRQNHCHIFQGYYFSHPLPGDEFEAFAQRSQPLEPA